MTYLTLLFHFCGIVTIYVVLSLTVPSSFSKAKFRYSNGFFIYLFIFFWYEYVWWGREVVFLLILWGFVELELRLSPCAFPLPLYHHGHISPPSFIFIPLLEVIHFEDSPCSVCIESLLLTRTLFSSFTIQVD